MQIFMEEASI